jgi:D-amino peptidase
LKVYISVDMEGITGITHRAQVSRDIGGVEYSRGCQLMTGDVNAAVEGIFEVDRDAEVIVNDAHGKSQNLVFEDMDERVKLLRGSAEFHDMVMGIDESYDGLMLIGYHSNLKSKDAVLCHAWGLAEIYFNDRPDAGEISISAHAAGHFNVPTVLITGDESIREEVDFLSTEFGPIEQVYIKEGLNRYTAICLHPKRAQRLIKEGAANALRKLDQIKPAKLDPPVKMELHFVDPGQADSASMMPGVKRTGPITTVFTGKDFMEVNGAFYTQVRLGTRQWLQY